MMWWFTKKHADYLVLNRDEQLLLMEEIRKAHLEWSTALSMFDNVVDPDEIDHIIFLINAAEKRYMTLYKRAKLLHKEAHEVRGSDVS
ncbi:YaaL family protein [Paenibacillus albiflavus]|nr:YaaL family protein [Paenibacillus albiflavus]